MAANDDIAATPPGRLAEVGASISRLFDSLKHIDHKQLQVYSGNSTTLEHEAERFELWAVNLGLHHFGHSSLDYRLREVDLLQNTFRTLLIDLEKSLMQMSETDASGNLPLAVATGTYEPGSTPGEPLKAGLTERELQEMVDDYGSDSDEDQETDYALLVQDVSDIVDRLYKISTKIRTSSNRIRSSRALQYREVNEETQVDLIAKFRHIDELHLRELFRHYQGSQNADAEHFLEARLSAANTRRRQQFGHWRQHHQKMTQVSLREMQKIAQARTSATPSPMQLKHVPEQIDPINLARVVVGPSVTTATHLTATRIRLDEQSSVISISTYGGSDTVMDDGQEFPEPPKSFSRLKYFQCPYCYTLCSSSHLEKRAWRSHLIHDLRPYVCTYEPCELGHVTYDRRQDWVEHESSTHRKSWRCLEHTDQTFTNISAYEIHLHENHTYDAETQLEDLLRAGETIALIPERPCPFCAVAFDNNGAMERHVAKHLERIARFALPRSTGLEDEKDDGRKSSGQVEGTRASYSSLSTFSNYSSTSVAIPDSSHTSARAQPISSEALRHYQGAVESSNQSRLHEFITNLQHPPIQREEGEVVPAGDFRLPETLLDSFDFSSVLNHGREPPNPMRGFRGRDSELNELARLLLPDQSRKVVVLRGLGGVGKTELATQFVFLHRERYSSVYWFNASDEATLRGELASILEVVERLNREFFADMNQDECVREVLQWFSISGNSKWLLVLDNYEVDFDIRDYLPDCKHGSVLITARASSLEFAHFAEVLQLDVYRDSQKPESDSLGDGYIQKEIDAEREKKVDSLGYLQGGRQYKMKPFTLPGRGGRRFVLASDCAEILGYRDVHSFLDKNQSLYRVTMTEDEEDTLSGRDMWSSVSSHHNNHTAITARSVFQQFGSRIIKGGRRVRDDYWEAKSREQGYTEEVTGVLVDVPYRDGSDDIWVAVMCANNTDTHSFINALTDKDESVSPDRMRLHRLSADGPNGLTYEFIHNNRKVHLVDMPTFVSSPDNGLEILQRIAQWLLEKSEANIMLSGLLYLQRVNVTASSTATMQYLEVFKRLCGEYNYSHVIIVSTGWEAVHQTTGIRREEEMVKTPAVWGNMVEMGSAVHRHDGSRESALRILYNIFDREEHLVLEIQREMTMGANIDDTTAGRFLSQRGKADEENKTSRGLLEPAMHQDSEGDGEVENINRTSEDDDTEGSDFDSVNVRKIAEALGTYHESLAKQSGDTETVPSMTGALALTGNKTDDLGEEIVNLQIQLQVLYEQKSELERGLERANLDDLGLQNEQKKRWIDGRTRTLRELREQTGPLQLKLKLKQKQQQLQEEEHQKLRARESILQDGIESLQIQIEELRRENHSLSGGPEGAEYETSDPDTYRQERINDNVDMIERLDVLKESLQLEQTELAKVRREKRERYLERSAELLAREKMLADLAVEQEGKNRAGTVLRPADVHQDARASGTRDPGADAIRRTREDARTRDPRNRDGDSLKEHQREPRRRHLRRSLSETIIFEDDVGGRRRE